MLRNAEEFTRAAFSVYVSWESIHQLAASLGYRKHKNQGPTLLGQSDVRFYRSELHGRDVFYLTHGGVLYLFAKVTNHVRKT